MAENKTKPTAASVEDFINTVKDEQKRMEAGISDHVWNIGNLVELLDSSEVL